MSDEWANGQADQERRPYEGPLDDYGEPKIGMEKLDIETRFPKDDTKPILYRFYFEDDRQLQAHCGPWRESRQDAYEEGRRWVKEGRL